MPFIRLAEGFNPALLRQGKPCTPIPFALNALELSDGVVSCMIDQATLNHLECISQAPSKVPAGRQARRLFIK